MALAGVDSKSVTSTERILERTLIGTRNRIFPASHAVVIFAACLITPSAYWSCAIWIDKFAHQPKYGAADERAARIQPIAEHAPACPGTRPASGAPIRRRPCATLVRFLHPVANRVTTRITRAP